MQNEYISTIDVCCSKLINIFVITIFKRQKQKQKIEIVFVRHLHANFNALICKAATQRENSFFKKLICAKIKQNFEVNRN